MPFAREHVRRRIVEQQMSRGQKGRTVRQLVEPLKFMLARHGRHCTVQYGDGHGQDQCVREEHFDLNAGRHDRQREYRMRFDGQRAVDA